MNWLKERWGLVIAALIGGFIFASGVFFLFGQIGLGIFLAMYFFLFLPWLRKRGFNSHHD